MFQILSTCKGGGYMYCRTNPPHPRANSKGLYPLHRVLAENKLGRLLEAREHVHHIDHVKTNDVPSNLTVMTVAEHAREHSPELPLQSAWCSACGCEFHVKGAELRKRLLKSVSGNLFCGRACQYEYLSTP